MRFHLNSREPCAPGALRAHLEAEKTKYIQVNFERAEDKLTVAERDQLAKDGAIVAAEMARGIDMAVVGADGHGRMKAGVLVHASIRGFAYPDDGRRALEVSVEEADPKAPR